MMHCGWNDAPPPIRAQVERLMAELARILGDRLTGIYLHGSLAMGCFNPDRSDLDLLAVTLEPLSAAAREEVVRLLLDLSLRPAPIEISFLSRAMLRPWRFPTPYDLHYSESWRGRIAEMLALGADERVDPDLAAHITILQQRGIALAGAPVEQLFPAVPPADYLAAIWAHDTRGAAEWIDANPVYGVLNLCRVLAYVSEGLIQSKEEGGRWGLAHLPAPLLPVIRQALAQYRGELLNACCDGEALRGLAVAMERLIEARVAAQGE